MKAGRTFFLLFTLFWSAVTLFFDAFCGYALVGQARSYVFVPVEARILASAVTSGSDGDGTTYGASVRYEYHVAGHRYQSERVRFGQMNQSDGKWARRTVQENPAGARRTAYHDPRQPAESVLQPGIGGAELFFALFLVPFNAVMLFMVASTVQSFRPVPPAGGARIVHRGTEVHVRLNPWPPVAIALAAAGGMAFLLMFAVAIPFGFSAPLWAAGLAWAGVGAAAVAGFLQQKKRIAHGRPDLVIDLARRVLTLAKSPPPAIKSWREWRKRRAALTTPRPVSFGDVEDVRVDERTSTDSDGTSRTYMVVLVLTPQAFEDNVDLDSWMAPERAESFAAWLRGVLGLDARRSS